MSCLGRVTLAAIVALVVVTPAAAEPALELAVKATFAVKFMSYIDWPADAFEDPAAPAVLCVAETDPLAKLLEQAAKGQSAGQHPIVVRRVAEIAGGNRCHLAVISGDARVITKTLAALGDLPIATVTDSRDGPAGGTIRFEVVGGRVRFHVDLPTARQNHLQISSKLLALALSVETK